MQKVKEKKRIPILYLVYIPTLSQSEVVNVVLNRGYPCERSPEQKIRLLITHFANRKTKPANHKCFWGDIGEIL